MRSVQSISNTWRRFTYGLGGLLLISASVIGFTHLHKASAQGTSYDPYADSVAGTTLVVVDANNAVGAPNGTNASLAGPGTSLTLDMGAGEEGAQTLRLHLGQINIQANVTVAFLDSNKAVISSESRLLGLDLNASTQNFAYNWTNYGKAYRYVRVSSNLGAGVNVDAVEALGYIGSTPSQDTDGDGTPDRNDNDPLVPNPKPSTPSEPAKPIPGASNTGNNGQTAGSATVSGQVNAPPATNNDKDGDGMADDWETANGLDPNNAKDAQGDPDHDHLTNLTEYKIGSNPQKMDTDGDGMPDDWEYKNGLDINKNDADGDPDGDFLTNLGEYRHHTDPNKADDLYKVFGKDCTTSKAVWAWLVGGVLLAFLVGWTLGKMTKKTGAKTSSKPKKSNKRTK